MYSDYHVHSLFSFDSEEDLANIINRAICLGMKEIAITDHQEFRWPVKNQNPSINTEEYFFAIDLLNDKYNGKIHILKGVELGLMEGTKSKCQNFIHTNSFDFVIGSCHIVNNTDPYYADFWENFTDREAFELYFRTLLKGIKMFDKIDTLGHLDYIIRYSPNKSANYSVHDYMNLIDEILRFIISRDIKLEINTANLAKGFTFPNPHTDIIKRYKELGGEYVTVGSDAHKAGDIGYKFDTAADIIQKYNLKVYCK